MVGCGLHVDPDLGVDDGGDGVGAGDPPVHTLLLQQPIRYYIISRVQTKTSKYAHVFFFKVAYKDNEKSTY